MQPEAEAPPPSLALPHTQQPQQEQQAQQHQQQPQLHGAQTELLLQVAKPPAPLAAQEEGEGSAGEEEEEEPHHLAAPLFVRRLMLGAKDPAVPVLAVERPALGAMRHV